MKEAFLWDTFCTCEAQIIKVKMSLSVARGKRYSCSCCTWEKVKCRIHSSSLWITEPPYDRSPAVEKQREVFEPILGALIDFCWSQSYLAI